MDIEVQLIVDGRSLRVMPDTYTRTEDGRIIPREVYDEVRTLSKLRDGTPMGCAFCAFRERRAPHTCSVSEKIASAVELDCGNQDLVYVDPSEMDAYNVAKTILGAQS